MYLEKINHPRDIKNLSIDELNELAKEIRQTIINVVSKNGGHLAPNLGAVELIVALHYIFDSPKDKIIFDVGHQAYAHKLLTGRYKNFHTLRQLGGISGYPTIKESEHDAFGTGHASTSISAALGMAVARDYLGENYHVIAVIGDGALTGGMAYEGLNNAGFLKKNLIVVVNDNKMSISQNVGGISRYLRKISMTPAYNELKNDVWNLLGKLPPRLSGRARELVRKIKEGLKTLFVPNILFEELGFRYIGPVDGHNLEELIEVFNAVKNLQGPILVHVLTEKGKGYHPAEDNPTDFHGLGPFNPLTGEPYSKGGSYSEIFGKTLIKLAEKNDKLVAVTAAMPEGTGLKPFRQRFPDRLFDVGIAEQHAVTFSAGLALRGLRPVCAIYSTFLQRGFDQVIHDVCLQDIPIMFCLDRAGLVGEDGPTHHGAFDLSYLRLIPNLVVCAPKDKYEFEAMLEFAVNYTEHPIAIRYPKTKACEIGTPEKIELGKAELLKEGKKGYIFAIGSMVEVALKAVNSLDGFGVVNARFVKPLDRDLLLNLAKKVDYIVTTEENVLPGGFGSAVLELLTENGFSAKRILRLGIPDKFIEHGKRDELLALCGLTPEKVVTRVKEFIKSS